MDYGEALLLLNASAKNYQTLVLRSELVAAELEASNILWVASKLVEITKIMRLEQER
jgi:hypothetical protein